MTMEELLQQKGHDIYTNIEHLLSERDMSKTDLALRIGRSPESFFKLLSDLKKGQVSLKNLLLIAQGLELKGDLTQLVKTPRQAPSDITAYKAEILEVTSRMAKGTIFELNQLLDKHWHLLSRTDRQRFGKEFYREVKAGMYPHVKFLRKRSDNHAIYKINDSEAKF